MQNLLVWDGTNFHTMANDAAHARVAKGGCEIATGVCNNQLRTREQLRSAGNEEKVMPPGVTSKGKGKGKSKGKGKGNGNYTTREMKASTNGSESTTNVSINGGSDN